MQDQQPSKATKQTRDGMLDRRYLPPGERDPRRRRIINIRLLLLMGSGLILALGALIAGIGYYSLTRTQFTVNTTFTQAHLAKELSLSFQRSFLRARQNETAILNRWRVNGFDVTASVYTNNHQRNLIEARANLDSLENLGRGSSDSTLKSTVADIQTLRPLLDKYDAGFLATVTNLRERSRTEGLDNQLLSELAQIETTLRSLSNPEFQQLTQLIRANQNAYLGTGRQEFLDNIRLKGDRIIILLNSSTPDELGGLSSPVTELVGQVTTYLDLLNQVAALEQNIQINQILFLDITAEVDNTIERLASASDISLTHASTQLETINRQSMLALSVVSALALILGVFAALIIAQRISTPLVRLSKAAEELGQGNLSQRTVVTSVTREIATLGEAFNLMADQLQQTLTSLEQRVDERTHDLERRSAQLQAASEIARDITATRELDLLLNQAVTLIRDRFGFYHAGIFLVDAAREFAVLQAATGEAGRKMLESGHKLKVGTTGIVGFVAGTGQPRVALDVGADAVHFKNPLLPDTRSELGVPLKVGQLVVGVLDVQSREQSAFSPEDVTVLHTMADQLAVALDNLRLYQQAQENLEQIEAFYGSYSRTAWERMGRSANLLGYQYDHSGVSPLQADSSRSDQRTENPGSKPEADSRVVHLPLKVRGQTIASLDVWPNEQTWSNDQLNLLQAISDRISLAMESARVFDDAQSRAAREQALNQLVARFSQSLDLDTLLQTAVRELGQLPNVSEVSVFVTPSEPSELGDTGDPQNGDRKAVPA